MEVKAPKPVSVRREQLWNYILGYISDNGYSPTFTEMGFHLGVTKGRAEQILHMLRDEGLVTIDRHKWRNVRIVEDPERKKLFDI